MPPPKLKAQFATYIQTYCTVQLSLLMHVKLQITCLFHFCFPPAVVSCCQTQIAAYMQVNACDIAITNCTHADSVV